MKVLVNGVGNIGTTLLNLLIDFKSELGISEIYALKKSKVDVWNEAELQILSERGVTLCSETNTKFKPLSEIIGNIDYIFDCNANGMGLKNKTWYESLSHIKGFSTQGSEKGFGIPFMSNVNNDEIRNQRFVQVVSCNTHSLSTIVQTLTNNNFDNLISGDFVVVRRSEDIGNHQRLVSANVVSRHMQNDIGTHHAIDVKDLFETKGIHLNLQSSDITTPSQLMHTVRFSLKLKKRIDIDEMSKLISENPYIATTSKYDSNVIFELGRRYSRYGRLYSHAILNWNNLLLDEYENTIKGWAFIPQEGNSLLSTIHAYLLQTGQDGNKIEILQSALLRKEW